jgi:hypothetical protein
MEPAVERAEAHELPGMLDGQESVPNELVPQFPGPRQPCDRVQTEKSEGADQQGRHSPKRVEQRRILVGIVMRRVRQIPGELPMRARMALAARVYNVGPREP